MSLTIVRKKNQATVPAKVLAQAGIGVKDKVDWRFEDGEIRGRRLVPENEIETLETMPQKMGKISNASIREAVRAARR